MESEYEVKYFPIDKMKLRKKLKKLGAKLVHPERKMKRAIVDNIGHPQIKVHYIRVRDEGDLVRLSAKIHAEKDGEVGDQKELDVVVSDFDKTVEIIRLMGFEIDKYQETLRETWRYKGALIEIDTWPWIEPRVEIEAVSEEQVRSVSDELEYDWDQKIITGMTELYMEKYDLPEEEVHKKISHLTFETNPFDTI